MNNSPSAVIAARVADLHEMLEHGDDEYEGITKDQAIGDLLEAIEAERGAPVVVDFDAENYVWLSRSLLKNIDANKRQLGRLRAQRGTNAATANAIERRENDERQMFEALAKVNARRLRLQDEEYS